MFELNNELQEDVQAWFVYVINQAQTSELKWLGLFISPRHRISEIQSGLSLVQILSKIYLMILFGLLERCWEEWNDHSLALQWNCHFSKLVSIGDNYTYDKGSVDFPRD